MEVKTRGVGGGRGSGVYDGVWRWWLNFVKNNSFSCHVCKPNATTITVVRTITITRCLPTERVTY